MNMFRRLSLVALLWSAGSSASPLLNLETQQGTLQGAPSAHGPNVAAFKGIAFSQPPVGDLRWRPPRIPTRWAGTRSADTYGAPCWQPITPETSLYSRGQMDVSEDCLYLNVWSAAVSDEEKRPVMVWYHGGGNTSGHGSSLIFDGTNLAKKGVVLVTANYRLGPMGFFSHPALTAESENGSSGNYALLDQIAALEWVRDNIRAFGGDPDRVTIFGQSAGALDVCLLMASPLARDLIDGAIAQSGGCMRTSTPLVAPAGEPSAHAGGLQIAAALGVVGENTAAADALRAIAPDAFVAGAATTGLSLSTPIVDGWVIPAAPRSLFKAGKHNRIPMIAGVMADEFRGLGANIPEMTQTAFQAQIRERFPAHADAVLAQYKSTSDQSTQEALRKISTHSFFAWQSRTMARLLDASGDDAYYYHFSSPTSVFRLYVPARPNFPVEGGTRALGAFHSGDLAYVFNNIGLVGVEWQARDYALSDTISGYWINFAANGDPNGPGLPEWLPYRTPQDNVQVFGDTVENAPNPLHQQLNLFDKVYAPD